MRAATSQRSPPPTARADGGSGTTPRHAQAPAVARPLVVTGDAEPRREGDERVRHGELPVGEKAGACPVHRQRVAGRVLFAAIGRRESLANRRDHFVGGGERRRRITSRMHSMMSSTSTPVSSSSDPTRDASLSTSRITSASDASAGASTPRGAWRHVLAVLDGPVVLACADRRRRRCDVLRGDARRMSTRAGLLVSENDHRKLPRRRRSPHPRRSARGSRSRTRGRRAPRSRASPR